MIILPEAPSVLVHAQGTPTVSVTPANAAGDVNQILTISIMVSGVDNLQGYNVVFQYDSSILQEVSANFVSSPDVFAGFFPFVSAAYCFNPTSTCQSRQVIVGGGTVPVSGTAQIFSVNFMILTATPTLLTITEAELTSLDSSGNVIPIIPAIQNGVFLVPPSLSFVLPNALATPRVRHQSNGPHVTTLNAFIMMDTSNARAGFGGVLFEIVAPDGTPYEVMSNIAFMFPGNSTTVFGSFDFTANGNVIGTYQLSAVMLRCPSADPASCVNGASATGHTFTLKP